MDITAEIFDQLQWLFDRNGFNDHQLHCVLEFERPLDSRDIEASGRRLDSGDSDSRRALHRWGQSALDEPRSG